MQLWPKKLVSRAPESISEPKNWLWERIRSPKIPTRAGLGASSSGLGSALGPLGALLGRLWLQFFKFFWAMNPFSG